MALLQRVQEGVGGGDDRRLAQGLALASLRHSCAPLRAGAPIRRAQVQDVVLLSRVLRAAADDAGAVYWLGALVRLLRDETMGDVVANAAVLDIAFEGLAGGAAGEATSLQQAHVSHLRLLHGDEPSAALADALGAVCKAQSDARDFGAALQTWAQRAEAEEALWHRAQTAEQALRACSTATRSAATRPTPPTMWRVPRRLRSAGTTWPTCRRAR